MNEIQNKNIRAEILERDDPQGILEVCELLKMISDGGADPRDQDQVFRMLRFLEACMASWIESEDRSKMYDGVVKLLIYEVLRMYNR
jgi:hypothetical protein